MTRIGTLLLCLVFLVAQSRSESRQVQDSQVGVTISTYKRVVELVFPREEGRLRWLKYRLTLRFLPAPEQEAQIVINARLDGTYEVSLYALTAGSMNIDGQLDEIRKAMGREDPEEMAQRIRVEAKRVDVPVRVIEGLMARYQELRVSPYMATDISLGGARYECWFEAASNRSHFSMTDHYPARYDNSHPLAAWMSEVKAVVETAERTQRGQ